MDICKSEGGTPQSSSTSARGVSLTRSERTFLDALIDPFAEQDSQQLNQLGRGAQLREEDVAYLKEWILCHGVHWLTCEQADLDSRQGARVFRNPIVRKIINAAAEQGFCVGTSALKDELEDFYSQRIRNPYLPEMIRDNAADKLAKLKGYYPDAKDKSGGTNVQINFVNPYGNVPEVICESDKR